MQLLTIKIIVNNTDIFYTRFLNKEYIKSTDIKDWLSNIKLDIVQVNTIVTKSGSQTLKDILNPEEEEEAEE